MTDIKNVLLLLCRQISLCTEINLTPDHLLMAKDCKQNDNSMQSLWSILNILSCRVVNKKNLELNFQRYGKIKSTQLYFVYLGYSNLEFYQLSESYENPRALLLAFGWLIAAHDSINIIVEEKLYTSILASECINTKHFNIDDKKLIDNTVPSTILSQIHWLIHKCNKLNNNLKEIAESLAEKIRLITKIHDTSLNINNLPHLNVSELFLIKKLFMKLNSNEKLSQVCEKSFEELHNIGLLLEIYTKWRSKEKIFFNWMEIVIEDSKSNSTHSSIINDDELSTLICIIRHLTKKKIHIIKSTEIQNSLEKNNDSISELSCVSRFLRIDRSSLSNYNENERHIMQHLKESNQNSDRKMYVLNSELKLLMKRIPNCKKV